MLTPAPRTARRHQRHPAPPRRAMEAPAMISTPAPYRIRIGDTLQGEHRINVMQCVIQPRHITYCDPCGAYVHISHQHPAAPATAPSTSTPPTLCSVCGSPATANKNDCLQCWDDYWCSHWESFGSQYTPSAYSISHPIAPSTAIGTPQHQRRALAHPGEQSPGTINPTLATGTPSTQQSPGISIPATGSTNGHPITPAVYGHPHNIGGTRDED
jgi:hypothetical protein